MALELVNTVTISNSATLTLTGIDSNDVYMVTLNNLYMNTSGARPRLRFTKASDDSADDSSNYDYANPDMYAGQAFYYNKGANTSYYNGFSIGTGDSQSLRGVYFLYNFYDSSEFSYLTYEECTTNDAGEYATRPGGLVLTVAQSCNGMQWHSNNNNIASGTATLYRLKD